jgi:hypothetical protein
MLEFDRDRGFCNNCSHDWKTQRAKFSSLDDLVERSGLRRDELVTLADVGALNAFRRQAIALWRGRTGRPSSGELFTTVNAEIAENAETFFEDEYSAISALNVVDQDRPVLTNP